MPLAVSLPGMATAAAISAGAGVLLLALRRTRLGGFFVRAAPPLPDERARKLESKPVPPIGGLAIMTALLALWWTRGAGAVSAGAFGHGSPGLLTVTGLVSALALGMLDDRRPLPPALKFTGQVAVACLCVFLPRLFDGVEWTRLVLFGLGAVAAMNVANTFDNADGALTGAGFLGLACAGLPSAGALLGFLPFNLAGYGRRQAGEHRTPHAYLGDGGSHLIGLLLWSDPVARYALLVPALDLLHCSVRRVALGRAPWHGDRRHLAHGLLRRGWGARRVAVTLTLVALPVALGASSSWIHGAWVGGLITTGLFLGLRFPLREGD